MTEHQWVSIVALAGSLILAFSALASYRLSWKKGVVMALAWAAIFAAVTAFIVAVR